jgi:formylglycine-generating enzyme required for sulfatase activity
MLGADPENMAFGWDNEFPQHSVHVPAFTVDALSVTNAQFLAFIHAGGYRDRALWSDEAWAWIEGEGVTHPAFWLPATRAAEDDPRASSLTDWHWRAMFDPMPLPAQWPVYVSHAEASAFARWRGRRLMTEAEYHRAAEGATPGHVDFAGYDPVPVGSHPATVSVHGVHELIGNGWEWTSTVFAPFAGFQPMASYPEYSADFFDGQHYVMKGASPRTARLLTRPSFRNWFRPDYPHMYAGFRLVEN